MLRKGGKKQAKLRVLIINNNKPPCIYLGAGLQAPTRAKRVKNKNNQQHTHRHIIVKGKMRGVLTL